VYESEGGIPKIYSTGPDGVAGTPDDVRVRVGEDPESETRPIDALEECVQASESREFVRLAQRFVEAAAVGDSATLLSLCENTYPLVWALEYRASEPQLFAQAAGQLKVLFGDRRGDIVIVGFGFPYQGDREHLGIQFVQLGETWKIQWVQLNR
jgi:hypothetical protein